MKFNPLQTTNIRHFRALSQKLGKMIKDGSFFQLDQKKQFELRTRLANLYRKARTIFSPSKLRRTLAASAILLGLTGSIQAQSFQAPTAAPSGLTTENVPVFHFADIDGDGDQDAFFSFYGPDDNRIFGYQENIGTAEVASFGPIDDTPFGININFDATAIDFADVDVDGDLDLFIGSYDFDTGTAPIRGWENTGTGTAPNFPLSPATNPFNFQPSPSVSELAFADLDGDGDPDAMMIDYQETNNYDQFRYQENLGIMGTFPVYDAAEVNPFGLSNAIIETIVLDLADLDEDGDLDMIASGVNYAETDAGFNYFENTGTAMTPAFAAVSLNPFNLQVPADTYILIPTFVDIDGDGDMDILATTYNSTSEENDVLVWENLGLTSSKEISAVSNINLFPTLATDVVNWETQMLETVRNSNVQIVNIHGQVMHSESADLTEGYNQGAISTDDLATGMYVFNITDRQGNTLTSQRFFVK